MAHLSIDSVLDEARLAAAPMFARWQERLKSETPGRIVELEGGIFGARIGLGHAFDRTMSGWLASHVNGEAGVATAGTDFVRLKQSTKLPKSLEILAVADDAGTLGDLMKAARTFDPSAFDEDGYSRR